MPPDDFDDLRHIGDALEPELRASFYRMVEASKQYALDFIEAPNILELIKAGNTGALYQYAERLVSLGLIPKSLDFINVMLLIMLRSGVETVIITTALDLPTRDSVLDTVQRVAFRRGQRHGGQWVKNITSETVVTMRHVMEDGLKRGIGSSALGRELRGSIGLLTRHQAALQTYKDLLVKNVEQDRISVQASRRLAFTYERRLLAWRAEMIARTETMYAVHAGQMIGWQALVESGIIQESRTWIEWVVTEDDRLCPRCAPMDGKRVRFRNDEGEFGVLFVADEYGFPHGKPAFQESPHSRRIARRGPLKPIIKADTSVRKLEPPIEVLHPPLHPNCRCTLRLRFE